MKGTSIGALLVAALALPAAAQTAAPPAGRLLASNCFQCHGTHGAGASFDTIAGKSVDEIYHKLREMQAKSPGNDIMKAHARGYSDEQMRLVSAYLSQQSGGSDSRD